MPVSRPGLLDSSPAGVVIAEDSPQPGRNLPPKLKVKLVSS